MSCEDWHNFLLNSWHRLKSSFNDISNVIFSNKFLCFNYLVLINNNFFYFSVFTFDSNHFFLYGWDFHDSLVNDRNLNWSISNFLNNIAYFNYDWDLSWKFDNVRDLHNFFIKAFDFINFRYFSINNNKFFNKSWNLNYPVTSLNYRLSNSSLNFLHDFADVGSNIFNLSKNISNNRLLNCTIDLFNPHFFNFNLYDCLNFLDNLNNLLDISIDRDDFLDDTIYRYWNFHRDDWRLLDFNDFFNFYNFRYYSLDFDFARYFNSSFNNFFWFLFYNFHHFIILLNRYYLFYEFLNDSINFIVNIFDTLNLDDSILNDRNLNKFLNFSDLFDFNDSVNNFFYDLRYLNNLFNNSRDDYNLFYNLFNLNYFSYFNHLFDNFVDSHSNFFNSFNCSWNLNNLLNDYFDWIILSDKVIYRFFYFNDLVDLNYLIYISDDLDYFRHFSSLYYNLSGDFRYSHNFLLDNRYFNSSIHNLFDLFYHRHWMIYNSFYLFYSVSINDLFFNSSNFLNCWDLYLYLNDLLNSFWYLNNLLNCLNNWNWLLNDNFDNFGNIHDLVYSFNRTSPFNDFNWFFNNKIERFYNLYYFFYYFFFDNFHFYYFSYDSLDRHNLLFNYLYFLDLRNSVVDNLFKKHRFFDFNNFFLNHLDFYYLWYLNYSLNDFFKDSGHLHYFFSILRYLYNFFNDVIHNFDNFDWYMNDLLDLLDFDYFNWFFNNPLNWNYLWHFNNSIHNFFNNLFNFNNFGYNSKNFQDIIHINNTHDLSIDHSNNSLVNVQHLTCFIFYFF